MALITFSAASFCSLLGAHAGPALASAVFVACAYTENGKFSGSVINPAAILSLHVWRQPLAPRVWAAAFESSEAYLLGIGAASVLLGLAKRYVPPMEAALPRKAKAD